MSNPIDNDPCETCGDSGYMWRPGPDGKVRMYDCDAEDCNAFGQFDYDFNTDGDDNE